MIQLDILYTSCIIAVCRITLYFCRLAMTPERQAKIERVLNLRQPDLAIVLENVNDPHNISAVMRTCDAVGVQNLYVLTTTPNRHKRYGKNASASAAGWITIHEYEDLEECMKVVKERYKRVYATHLGVESHSLYDLNLADSVALVFGNERLGVSAECLARCDGNFIIPQAGMVQSLNISVACAVSLYEAYRQRNVAGFYNGTPRLSEAEWKAVGRTWRMYEEHK